MITPAFLTAPAASYDAWRADVETFLSTVEYRVVRLTRDVVETFSRRAYERNGWTPSTERVEWTVHAFVGDVDLSAEAAELATGLPGDGNALHYAADAAACPALRTRKAATAELDPTAARFAEILTDRWLYYELVDGVGFGAVR